ncbi:MAG: metallophosphoesterase [Oscillospiraceae bacterium]
MSLYTIGDLHLSFGCDKPMDIFKGWENYLPRLTKNWNDTITNDDTIVIVGDISWGMTLQEAQADFDFINRLPGQKIILRGNHDYWFSTKKKCDDFLILNEFSTIKFLYNNAFEYGNYSICGTRGWINEQGEQVDKKVLMREAGRLRLSLEEGKKIGKDPIGFLHYPPVYYINECKEIIDVLNEYGVKRCFYGHIHGAGFQYAIDGDYQGINYRLVSCDYTDFRPVKVL